MPQTQFQNPERYLYHNGFGNYIESEAVEGAIPEVQNTPQHPPYGLYTERISGESFIIGRDQSLQTWQYRILPTAAQEAAAEAPSMENKLGRLDQKLIYTPKQLRWSPFDTDASLNWTQSMHLLAMAGDASTRTGLAYYIFTAGVSMAADTSYASADGDLLIILQHGVLDIQTELGRLLVRPKEICIIPRGIRHRVCLPCGVVRGYAVELFQGHYTLPELGPIGTFGLANARDFQIPRAAYDDEEVGSYKLLTKFNGQLFSASQRYTPFNVVAWHGTYYPCKYDLGRFMTFYSVAYDHPDPSIYTLLTSTAGMVDLGIFPPRWLCMENTMRPPWYHRNTMGEYMGLIDGEYDGRREGFCPGGASMHTVMASHGPDSETHQRASLATSSEPQRVGEGSLAFILESPMLLGYSEWALKFCGKLQADYNQNTWLGLEPHANIPGSARKFSALVHPKGEGDNSKEEQKNLSTRRTNGVMTNGHSH